MSRLLNSAVSVVSVSMKEVPAVGECGTTNARRGPAHTDFHLFRGLDHLLALRPVLQRLSARCGAAGALDAIAVELVLQHPEFGSKVPTVLLRYDADGEPESAVLVCEYRVRSWPVGIYVPFDKEGEWTVIAPERERSLVAREAAEFLLHRGANLVLLSLYTGPSSFTADFGLHAGALARFHGGMQSRTMPRTLPLEATYDASLARLGAHTRRNLRAFRRRVEKELGAQFVPEVQISEAEYMAVSERCLYPVPDAIARWRCHAYQSEPGAFMVGLRAQDGTWLSLLGGRRHGTTTRIDWQRNATEHRKLSLTSALRAYLIEHEVARGMEALRFEGGTAHSMSEAFVPEIACDLLFARPLLTPFLIERLLHRVLPKGGVLWCALQGGSFVWRFARRAAKTPCPAPDTPEAKVAAGH